MLETLVFQYLNKLSKGEVRDFATPESFHTCKVQGLGGDSIKPATQVSRKFEMPTSALIGDVSIKPCELTDSTPPIVRTFDFTTDGFIEFSEFFQGLFQRLWVLDFLTRTNFSLLRVPTSKRVMGVVVFLSPPDT